MNMNMEKSSSAIVLIEFQKQWTKKTLYNRLIKRQLNRRNVLQNTKTLIKKARSEGCKIIHAPLIIDPKDKKGWLAYLTFANVFTTGTWKSEFSEGVYEDEDHVVKGRYAFDAFIGSDLEHMLKGDDVKNLFLC